MPIVQPDAHARLEAAALELFLAQGYEQTTVLQIVQRAGVARRTFFRYFSSKREVLFWGTPALQDAYAAAVGGAPEGTPLIGLIERALLAAADLQGGARRDVVRRRQRVVDANVELQERQLLKRSERAASLAAALVARGVEPVRAAVVSEAALAAYGVAFRRWATAEADDLTAAVADAIAILRTFGVMEGDPSWPASGPAPAHPVRRRPRPAVPGRGSSPSGPRR